MLTINNLSYFLGDRPLYDNANLHIKPRDKIGLIGLNGVGKSTLLRIINGDYQPSSGEIQKSNDCSIGFLNQDLLSYLTTDSILSVAMEAFSETIALGKEIDEVLKQMETNYQDELVDRLAKLQEQYEAREGYSLQSKAEEILEGIGFKTADLQRPLKEFSGGWRMRVMLAKLLLEKPSLLMLDEPTNHLDLPSIQWIENYIRNYEGAVIIVSHDRQFLDNTTSITVEVAHQQMNVYPGNYSFYLKEKELRKEIQQNAYENQQQKIKQTERFIERFRSKATKASQVQSRVKALEKMDVVEEVVDDNATVNFQFDFKQRSGRFPVALNHISKSYGDLQIIDDSSLSVERGDKIALIGANGKGKSTMLRIIAGTEHHEGNRVEGYNMNLAFYAQHQLESLNVENEILEELKQAGSGKTEQELRSILGAFLFRDEEVFKKIKVLSGGEKSRVALAKTLISEANFLLLDEPTNHLDFQSVNILVQALQQFKGSYVIVSHDRHFIKETANKIWYIEDQQLKEYPGTYAEYVDFMKRREADRAAGKADLRVQPDEKGKKKTGGSPRPVNDKERKQKEKELAALEEKIEKLEAEKEGVEQELTKQEVLSDHHQLEEHTKKLNTLEEKLSQATRKWETLAEYL